MLKTWMLDALILIGTINSTVQAEVCVGDRHDYVKIKEPIVFMNQPSLQVGGFGEGKNSLGSIDAIEVDEWGNLYAADNLQRLIKVWSYYTLTGDVLEIISSADIEAAGLGPLAEIRTISAGDPRRHHQATRLYILDHDQDRYPESRILMRPHLFSKHWIQLPFTDFAKKPLDLTVDVSGRLVVAERKGTVEVLLADGSAHDASFAEQGILKIKNIEELKTTSLKTVDTDQHGNIYVADQNNGRIIKITPDGDMLQVFGDRSKNPDKLHEYIQGVAVDWHGNIYSRDKTGNSYLVFAPDGSSLTHLGEHSFEPYQQENTDQFVIDKQHRRFIIANSNNNRVSVHNLRRRPFLSRVFPQWERSNTQSALVQPGI
ncbi:MAG: hypothetical protein GY807_15655 [Gammaproteobacteria bacterium]|nr:hypothetical protein [Gammaproteobacteria bacterium]